MPRYWQDLARRCGGALVLAALLPLCAAQLACGVRGERAASCAGAPASAVCAPTCPDGEVCSVSVGGFSFLGPSGRDGLLHVARGGTERLIVLDLTPPPGATTVGTMRPFDAASSDPSVLGIDALAPPSVTVRGSADGVARLRILEPGTELLLDSVVVTVEDVDEIRITTPESTLLAPRRSVGAQAAGGTMELGVELIGTSGTQLWDDSMRVQIAGLRADGSVPDVGAVLVSVDRTVASRLFTLPIVAHATDLRVVEVGSGTTLADDAALSLAGFVQLCALPFVDDEPIAGAVVTFTASDSRALSFLDTGHGCVMVVAGSEPARSGPVASDIHVHALDRVVTLHASTFASP
jgi:hypothetical protein